MPDFEIHENEPQMNPLDHVEDVLTGHNWIYNRTNDDELFVRISGRNCSYNLYFIWQEHMNSLQYICEYEMSLNPENKMISYETVMDINCSLWIGHFEVMSGSLIPSFRYTILQGQNSCPEFIENLVDLSLIQCERYQPVFQILSQDSHINSAHLSLAMMETSGES